MGVAGRPSTLNGQVIKTRACADIENAYLYATTPHMFAGATEASFNKLRDSVKIPMYGERQTFIYEQTGLLCRWTVTSVVHAVGWCRVLFA